MAIDRLVLGIAMSIAAIVLFKVFSKYFGNRGFATILYWYFPTSNRLMRLGIPPSHVRVWSKWYLEQVMKFKIAQDKMRDYEAQRDKLLILSASLLLVVILESLFLLLKNQRVILLPPEVWRELLAQGNKGQ